MKINLLFCLTVFQSAMLLGMESDRTVKILNGFIHIVKYSYMRYMDLEPYDDGSSEKTRLELVLNKKFSCADPVVEVWVCHDENNTCSWSNSYYGEFSKMHSEITKNVVDEPKKEKQDLLRKGYENTFPRFFPLSLLDREEDDTIELSVCDLPVKLKCKQLPFYHGKNRPVQFHDALEQLKTCFIKNPLFHLEDKEILIKKGIIVKTENTDKYGMYIYKHGNNGYPKKSTQEGLMPIIAPPPEPPIVTVCIYGTKPQKFLPTKINEFTEKMENNLYFYELGLCDCGKS